MDRYLFSGALALLILQSAFLFQSLKTSSGEALRHLDGQKLIGQLVKRVDAVKRKSANSIIWDEPTTNENLFAYDSILTLDDSSAELNLQGGVKLRIHENTLVVLEPPSADKSESLKVRFQRGLFRSQNQGQAFQVGSLGWTIEAAAGSDLSLRSVEGDKVELEVQSGDVQLTNQDTAEVKAFTSGQKLSLEKEKITNIQIVDQTLAFTHTPPPRIYSHQFPLSLEFSWGEGVEQIEILRPHAGKENLTAPQSQHTNINFEAGTYILNLRGGDRVSPAYVIELKPAPRIQYLSPLPRNRIDVERTQAFSWFPIDGVSEYFLSFTAAESESQHAEFASKSSFTEIQFRGQGLYNWQVSAKDLDGYSVPPYYSLPVYFTKNPLKPPVLREPAKENKTPPANKTPDQGWLKQIFHFILPEAAAQEAALPMNRQIVLSWYPVEGANFYVIEISETADFLKPVIVKKIRKEEFTWNDFKDKTYYWRVAGGNNNGQMGVFSEPGEFNVANLRILPSMDLAPGVKYVERPAPKPTATPTPSPTPKPAPTSVPAPPEPEAVAPEKLNHATVGFSYGFITQADDQYLSANFEGALFPSLQYERVFKMFRQYWLVAFDYQNLTMRPKDDGPLTMQQKLSSQLAQIKISKFQTSGFGLNLRQVPILERKGPEELKFKSANFAGLDYTWTLQLDEQIWWRPSVELGYGDLGYASYENTFEYALSERQSIAAQFDLMGVFGGDSNHHSTWIQFGFGYAWRW